MDSFDDIVRKRSMPGVVILSTEEEPVYISDDALRTLKEINGTDGSPPDTAPPIPDEVYRLCRSMNGGSKDEEDAPSHSAAISRDGRQYMMRASPLFRTETQKESEPSYIMVVIEPYLKERRVDTTRTVARFGLSKREAQIVDEVVKGGTNREIAEELGIREDTVKDHIKNIMRKMDVHSRTAIFSRVTR
ncbi:MAG: helix-turn-helix transcriptional regulator [Thermodesulfobacteriota bacterium]